VVRSGPAALAEIGIMTEENHDPVAAETPPAQATPPAPAPHVEETPHVEEMQADPMVAVQAESAPLSHAEPEAAPTPEPEAAASLEHEPEAPDHEPEAPDTPVAVEDDKPKKNWYVVKVQSGREDTIREAILRKVRKEGLEDCFGQIYIPVEKVSEVKVDKNGKKVTRTRERRLYAGYLFVEAEYNDRILYLFRETSGVGGFVGEHPGHPERAPTPMTEREIQRMIGPVAGPEDGGKPDVPPPPKLSPGDHVRVIDGPFNGMDRRSRRSTRTRRRSWPR